MKQKLMAFIMLLCTFPAFAQTSGEIRGRIIDEATDEPLQGIVVILRNHNLTTQTDERGVFSFSSLQGNSDMLSISSAKIVAKELKVKYDPSQTTWLKDIRVAVRQQNMDRTLIGVIDEDMIGDDEGGLSQDVSPMVILSNDMYLNNIAYQMSAMRFKVRGYDNNYEQKYINGVAFNDQVRGVFNYSAIGALNDATRNGDAADYLSPSRFTFGGIGRSENINMRSGNYAHGGKLTASYTNRNYYLRGMASYATGMRDDGWAFNFTLGGRYSDRGYIDGVFYDNISYALGVEKQWDGGRHSISFVTFGSPVRRGQQGGSYQEVYDLRDNNLYNPNWGYQNGKRRNSKVVRSFDPTAVLSHVWKINEKMRLTTGVGSHYNRYGGTALNWYNAPDPRPDYYRNLPSYYAEDPEAYDYYKYLWKIGDPNVTQINWDNLYLVNELSAQQGSDAALYMLEERRKDLFELSMNSTFDADISDHIKVIAGVGLRNSQSYQFKTVKDLLGSQYVLDIDKFAERDFPGNPEVIQNDLLKPNRRAYKGDTFGYDFKLNINHANTWIQNIYKYRNFDFFLGAKLAYTNFYRKGFMMNGRYPDNSYGRGKKHDFWDYGFKGGLTYKINGRHFLTANLGYMTEAPLVDKAYVSPRISDNTSEDLKSAGIFTADMSYVFSLPSIHGRVSVFQTNFYDLMHRTSYYHDAERTFINHLLTGLNKVHRGVEFGLNYKLNDNWNFDLAGTIAEYYYSNNPDGTISYENGKVMNMQEKVYMKNYYTGSTPQIAGTLGINYFKNYWFLSANINGFGRNYVDISPLRRMASTYANVVPGTPEYDGYRELTSQERYGSAYTVDLSIGKILYLKNRNSLNFNFSVNNLLNRESIRTGGYEQGRLDLLKTDKFNSRYYYMQGINCFLNASYKF